MAGPEYFEMKDGEEVKVELDDNYNLKLSNKEGKYFFINTSNEEVKQMADKLFALFDIYPVGVYRG